MIFLLFSQLDSVLVCGDSNARVGNGARRDFIVMLVSHWRIRRGDVFETSSEFLSRLQ